MADTQPPRIPSRPVVLGPGARLTFRLGGRRCGVRRAPPAPEWGILRVTYLDPDERITVEGGAVAATYVLFQVQLYPRRGDAPPRVTVWIRDVPANPNDLGWRAERQSSKPGRP